jgi:hypothetical protein
MCSDDGARNPDRSIRIRHIMEHHPIPEDWRGFGHGPSNIRKIEGIPA